MNDNPVRTGGASALPPKQCRPPAAELRLGDEPDAARRARRHTDQVISASGRAELADLSYDAQLVVSELVTNACLHAAPPIVVVVRCLSDRVRIQVADATRTVPMRGIPSKDSMTGRGIALVETLARCWGVAPAPRARSSGASSVSASRRSPCTSATYPQTC